MAVDPLEALCRGFSCPSESWDASFASTIATARTRQTLRLFLDKFSARLAAQSRGVIELFAGWLASDADLATVWHPAFSGLYHAVLDKSTRQAVTSAAAVALALGVCGMPGDWEIVLPEPQRLRWGHWLLPAATRIRTRSDGSSATVRTQSEGDAPSENVFHRVDGGWQGSGADPLPQFGTNGSRITLLPRDALDWDDFAEWLPLAVDAVTPEMALAWQETIAFMDRHAPAYVPWVQRLLRDIALLGQDEYLRSGSSGGRSGLIHASVRYQPAPLGEILVDAERIGQLAARTREVLGERLAGLSMQTNATLLDPEWVEVLRRHQIRVGVSLDGPPEIHDAVRVDHAGRGSQHATLHGLRLLREAHLDPGVLCVINPGVSGAGIYRYFRSIGITRRMNFLLPDVSHDTKERLYGRYGPTPVAGYLIPIFDAWLDENDPAVRVQPLRDLIQQLLGGPAGRDDFGNSLMSYLIIETDGTIHALDALRVCEDGIAESGLNVFGHGFDDLHRGLPLVYRAVHEGFPLPAACRGCPEKDICGGGYLPHRYARANGFDNPSIWCADILKLLGHIRTRLIKEKGTSSLRDVPPAA